MIEVYITHYVTEEIPGYNDLAVDCAHGILEATQGDGVPYQLIFIYWAANDELDADLRARMPPQVDLVRETHGLQQHLMNQSAVRAKANSAEFFVCLHNDIRPCPGWLRNLAIDLRTAEEKYGRASSVCMPRYIPYHWLEPHPDARASDQVWSRLDPRTEPKILTPEVMAGFCKQHGFEFNGRHVLCPETTFTTDDGHQLMMYGAAPEFFDEIGGCDETFIGVNFGDNEWGMRAIMAGKKNLISQGCIVQHIAGLTFNNPIVAVHFDDNHHRFIAKWGMDIYRQMQDGSLWTRLHREQRERRAAEGLPP